MWFEVAIVASIFAIGNILFGHFEEGTPKWRRLAKFLLFVSLSVLISATAGRLWFFAFLVAASIPLLIIHFWWLPKHGINGWTGEPKDKYYCAVGSGNEVMILLLSAPEAMGYYPKIGFGKVENAWKIPRRQ